MDHTGLVTFHELGPNLTRVLLGFDVQPGGMLEKFARGARHVKRAARGDLHRFKAFIEMAERETGAWRGVIEDGEVVQEHDRSYDKKRDYTDVDELVGQRDSDESKGDDERASGKQKARGGARSRSGQPGSSQSRQRQSGQGRSRQAGQSGSRGRQSGSARQTRGRGESSSRRGSSSGSTSGRSRTPRTSTNRRSSSSRQS
jgi:hypothetical protein